jgi:uncharacterized protein (UPF0333 family)
MFYARTKGQSTLEYVILIGFVVAALIAMGVYMKRGSEGQLRESADRVGEQYDALNTASNYIVTSHQKSTEVTHNDGGSTTTIDPGAAWSTKTGNETVNPWDNGDVKVSP